MDKIIYTKLPIVKTDPIIELIKIVTSVMLYILYRKINSYSHCINNAQNYPLRYTKYYFCKFFKETFIQKYRYLLYQKCNNGFIYSNLHPQE